MHEHRTATRILIALILLNLLLKLLWLGRTEMAHDEPFTVLMAQRGWADLFAALRLENNPPLHFILTKLWSGVVPLDASWLRVPSAIVSALVVWPLFLLARSAGGIRVAVIAVLLFTFSNYHYGYAHEVRSYALFTLLATICMWQLWRMAEQEPRALLWFSIASIAMVYTHFFGWLMLGVVGFTVLIVPEMRDARRSTFIAIGIALLSYLPYFGTFLGRMGDSVEQGTWLKSPEPEEVYNMIWRWSNVPVVAVIILLVIVVAVARTGMRNTGIRIGLLWTFLPLIGMFLISYRVPIFLDRYLVYAAPGFCLLVAMSLAHVIREGLWQWVPTALVLGGMAFTFTPWKEGELHPSRVVAQVQQWRGERGAVLLTPPFYAPTFAWHLDKELFRDPEILEAGLDHDEVFPTGPHDQVPKDTSEFRTVVLVDAWSALTDPDQLTKKALRAQWPTVDSVEADKKVWVYRYCP